MVAEYLTGVERILEGFLMMYDMLNQGILIDNESTAPAALPLFA